MLVANDPETLDPRYAAEDAPSGFARPASFMPHSCAWTPTRSSRSPIWPAAGAGRTRQLEIDLRDDVSFHSGAPLRARDVVETLRAFASPRVASRHASVVDAIAYAREDGEHRVIVRMSRPHATLLTDLELPILRADEAGLPARALRDARRPGSLAVARAGRGEVLLVPADGGAGFHGRHAVTLRTVHDENTRALRLEAEVGPI